MQDQLQRRLAKDEGLAEIARGDALQEVEILFVDRLIEAQRPDGAFDFSLICLGVDQHIHRIADHVDAEEDDQRHDEDDDDRLHQAPDDEYGHAMPPKM